jgi:hypothetical protein
MENSLSFRGRCSLVLNTLHRPRYRRWPGPGYWIEDLARPMASRQAVEARHGQISELACACRVAILSRPGSRQLKQTIEIGRYSPAAGRANERTQAALRVQQGPGSPTNQTQARGPLCCVLQKPMNPRLDSRDELPALVGSPSPCVPSRPPEPQRPKRGPRLVVMAACFR